MILRFRHFDEFRAEDFGVCARCDAMQCDSRHLRHSYSNYVGPADGLQGPHFTTHRVTSCRISLRFCRWRVWGARSHRASAVTHSDRHRTSAAGIGISVNANVASRDSTAANGLFLYNRSALSRQNRKGQKKSVALAARVHSRQINELASDIVHNIR